MSSSGFAKLTMLEDEEIKQMEERLAIQAKKLKQLEKRLQQERQDKASLEQDFQHVLDQLQMLAQQQLIFS